MRGLLVDTGFLIRFLRSEEALNKNATDYYRFCLEREVPIFCSTIAIAEYCVKGRLGELPLKTLRLVPFNIRHGEKAGELMRLALEKRAKSVEGYSRICVTNDVKMFAQAEVEESIDHFITADQEAIKLFHSIRDDGSLRFQIMDLNVPRHEAFGELGL